MERRFQYLSAAVAILIIMVYAPVLQNGFVNWDDNLYIKRTPEIRSLGISLIGWAATTMKNGSWNPLVWISYAIDYRLWGLDPRGYHLQNVLIHALNVFIAIILLYRLATVRRTDGKTPAGETADPSGLPRKYMAIAVLAGILFGLHPLRVESVAWVAERKDVLFGFFFLLSLYTYYAGREHEERVPPRNYFLSLSFFLFALMAKPMAITLPVVIVILDIALLKRSILKSWKGRVPFFALSLLDAVITLKAQAAAGSLQPNMHLSLLERALNAVNAYAFYFWKLIYPSGLSPLYPYTRDSIVFNARLVVSFLLLSGVTFLCLRAWRGGWRWPLAAWATYLVLLIPVIGVLAFGEQAAADRYTYLPSLGLSVIISGSCVHGAHLLLQERQYKFWVPLVSVIIILIMIASLSRMTLNQIAVWHDSQSLWGRVLALSPSVTPTPYIGLGYALLDEKKYREAYRSCDTALSIKPDTGKALTCRAEALYGMGSYDDAISDYTRLLLLDPGNSSARNGRGVVYLGKKEYRRALDDFHAVLSMSPWYPVAMYNLACAYSLLNDKPEACRWLTLAFQYGFEDRDQLTRDPGLENIKDEPCYRQAFQAKNQVGHQDSFMREPTKIDKTP